MSNNNPKDNDSRADQEDQVLWEFRNVFQNLHGQLLDDPLHLTQDEEIFLEDLYSDPTLYCVAAGVVTFGLLKGVRGIRTYTKQRRLRQQSGGGYSMDAPPPTVTGNYNNPPPFPPSFNNTGGIKRFFTLANLFDVSLSSLMGVVTGAYLIDMDEHRGGLDRVPLMEGQSAISDAFCPVLMEEYQRQWNMASRNDSNASWESNNPAEYNLGILSIQFKEEAISPKDHKDILQNPQTDNLQAYIGFVQNCKRRQALEQKIREERGMSSDEPVAIPSPGVEAHDNGGDPEEEWSSEEVSSWVSDQED